MSEQSNKRMRICKRAFFVLLIPDFIGAIVAFAAFVPMFGMLAGYGKVMLIVAGIISAMMAAVMLFEIVAKIFLIRSSCRKGCGAVVILLFLFNLGAVIMGVLSAGGEGATLTNQLYLYLQMLASVAEMIIAVFYLRTIKKDFQK